MDFYITIQRYIREISYPETRVLFEFVSSSESLGTTGNGPYDESS